MNEVKMTTKNYIIGADEVGTGSLAGALIVCGFKAPANWSIPGLNDSKKLSAKKRTIMRDMLLALVDKQEVIFHIAERTNIQIDQMGMAAALKDAYVEVFHKLYSDNSQIIIDGMLKFDGLGVDSYDKISIIKADTKFPQVMAASILGKTYRDAQMIELDKIYPAYDWKNNVGYPAKTHLTALDEVGPCSLHRFSYAPVKKIKDKLNLK